MPSIERVIADAITDVVADNAPGMIADAMLKAAGTADDPLAQATLGIIAEIVRKEGPAAVEATSSAIVGLINGSQPSAAFELRDYPDQLDALVTALQNAEGDRKREAVRWAEVAGATMKQIGGLIASALIKRL